MRLLEHEAKQMLNGRGIQVPHGFLARKVGDISELKGPSMLKAQVPTGGRGKAGGVIKVLDLEEAKGLAKDMFERPIKGFYPSSILIEEVVDDGRETYMGLTIDRSSKTPMLLISGRGGMDIENVPVAEVLSIPLDIYEGISVHHAREIASFLQLGHEGSSKIQTVLTALWRTFREDDCELVEINPLIISSDGAMIAVDAKIIVNDDALFRHPEFENKMLELSPLEAKARKKGISLVKLEGDIGVIANGAGLTMATLDALFLHGGKGGAFLDLGGTDDPSKVVEAIELMHELSPRVLLINIFGGITRCDTVARGIIDARKEMRSELLMVVRMKGVREREARQLLIEAGIEAVEDLDTAALKASTMGGQS